MKFSCPKFANGVLCCDCDRIQNCPFIKPARTPNRLCGTGLIETTDFTPLPIVVAEWQDKTHWKRRLKMSLLVAEDFQLTKSETDELVHIISQIHPIYQKGGRGKSWRKVIAVVCIYLLERDKRPIYKSKEAEYNRKYKVYKELPFLYRRIKEEVAKLSYASLYSSWWKLSATKRLCDTGSLAEPLAIPANREAPMGIGTPQVLGNL